MNIATITNPTPGAQAILKPHLADQGVVLIGSEQGDAGAQEFAAGVIARTSDEQDLTPFERRIWTDVVGGLCDEEIAERERVEVKVIEGGIPALATKLLEGYGRESVGQNPRGTLLWFTAGAHFPRGPR